MSKTLTPAEAIEAAARALYGHSIRREATVDERVLTWDELDLYAHLRWFGDAGAALLAVGYVSLTSNAEALSALRKAAERVVLALDMTPLAQECPTAVEDAVAHDLRAALGES